MQALLASDVIYLAAHDPWADVRVRQERDIDERFPTDRFLPDLGWLDPDTVADAARPDLGRLRARPRRRGCTAPASRASRSSRRDVALTESGVNRVPVSDQLTFDVKVQNQGESEETDVTVSIAISDGKQINVDQTIPRIAAGAEETVSIPIPKQPDTEAVSTVTVEVEPVPGEGTRENNRIQYQVAFTE